MSCVVYCDGGVLGRNPSPAGGTWAWAQVDMLNRRVTQDYGYVVPDILPTLCTGAESGVVFGAITNNLTEFLAMLLALEALPVHWCGTIRSDSGMTIGRIRSVFEVVAGRRDYTHKMEGIPGLLVSRALRQANRLGEVTFEVLAGHPTKEDLRRGFKVKHHKLTGEPYQLPVSVHNKWVDAACGFAAERYKRDTERR